MVKSSGKTITYFLHFPLGKKEGKIYIKDLLNNYFKGISKYCNIKIVASYIPKQFYHNAILSNNVSKHLINAKDNGNLFKKISFTFNVVKNSDICFLFMPSMSSVIAGLFCIVLKKPFVAYFGASWFDITLSNSNKNKKFLATIRKILSNIISKKSKFSLYTGKDILMKHKGNSKYLTVPILNFSQDNSYQRRQYKNLVIADKITILFVGSLSVNKGVSFLIEAIRILNDKRIFLNIIGDGNERKKLEKQVKDFSLENNILFHGFVTNGPELYKYYRECDIFVLPSFSEGLPRVLYEAAGNGCTIVTTPVNSVPYLFKDNYDCLFIKPGDANNISEILNRLINEPGLNKRLAENAYNTVEHILKESAYEQHYRLIKTNLL